MNPLEINLLYLFGLRAVFLPQKIFLHCKMILFPLSFVFGGGLLVLVGEVWDRRICLSAGKSVLDRNI